MIEIRQLRHFVAVVEFASFSLAAEQIFVSQSALTRSIQRLERRLDTILLTRGSRSTVPTAAGTHFLAIARSILNDCSDAVEELREMQAGSIGDVVFGFDPLFTHFELASALANLETVHPSLTVRAVEAQPDQLTADVANGTLDFAIIRDGTDSKSMGLEFVEMCRIEFMVIVGRGSPLGRRKANSARELGNAKWLILGDAHFRSLYRAFIDLHELEPTHAVRTNSLALARDQVLRNRFVSILPEPAIRRELRHGLMRPLSIPLPPNFIAHAVGIVQRTGEPLSTAAAIVRNIIIERTDLPGGCGVESALE